MSVADELAIKRGAPTYRSVSASLAERSPGRRSQRLAVYATALRHGAFGVAPLVTTAFVLYVAVRGHAFAVDFHNGEWPAGVRLLHGLSPYFDANSAAVLSAGSPHPAVTPMVYPALGALLCAAFALLPHTAADVTFTCLDVVSVVLALHILKVRDWRVYGVAFMWAPVVSGWQTANVTLLLVGGAAAMWRFRDRPALSGVILALLVSVKLILWPLALWLLATRRYVGLAWALGTGILVNVLAWGAVGFGELPRYIQVLRAFERAGEHRAYSIVSFALRMGASRTAATALGIGLALLVAGACFRAGRQGRDRICFTLCIAVALLATPIIWLHYFALLLVPLAIARPRVSLVWALPVALLICPPDSPATWQIAFATALAGVLIVSALRVPAGDGESRLRRTPIRAT
jgi:hypothetical protein